ncbi:MAG TPA: excinuclease ABC subunit UvrB [Nitrospirae bacterium]|nr:excinuclease ABC subunit UvrB [Nitrospirota bacterium]
MSNFELITPFKPSGDQPKAIEELTEGVLKGLEHQTLLGVTGSGKTFTIANVIANTNKPALIIAHNKALAAQLYGEFKELFPNNAVEFFVSYYDYYQPEAYIPSSDTYIEKDALVNEDIDRLRHSATISILERKDVIVVASVSCIYGIGSPDEYLGMHLFIEKGLLIKRAELLKKLTEMLYLRSDNEFKRGTFRARGDIVDIYPAFFYDDAIRVEFFGDMIDRIIKIDVLTGKKTSKELEKIVLYPNSHWITSKSNLQRAQEKIEEELGERIRYFKQRNETLFMHRIEQRTLFDLEMLSEFGFCHGIENYSRHLSGRNPGEPPYTLIDYINRGPSEGDYLTIIDESHVTVPQIGAMYEGDKSRKQTLVDYGFRLPSALDNRPLKADEFRQRTKQVIYVSATPGDYEIKVSKGRVIEQVIRPTGLVDPPMIIRPAKNQVEELLEEIQKRTSVNERILVTTLTKKMAEDLCDHYKELGIRVRYLHSDIDTLQRIEILRDLRLGVFDVLIGINLLREGLDLPEVSLVAVFDADKEGFLRSERSLIQTAGRAARNVNGLVILYADRVTKSMDKAIKETERRRKKQIKYNEQMGINPKTISSAIKDILNSIYQSQTEPEYLSVAEDNKSYEGIEETIKKLEIDMKESAKDLDFEKAAKIRDKIKYLRQLILKI